MAVRDKVFISYSHKDKKWCDELLKHLKLPERELAISVWVDKRIGKGSRWREDIDHALSSAKVAVLLVTANFFESDFIAASELPPIIGAQEKDGLTILWVAVGECNYQLSRLRELQCTNDPTRPLAQLKPAVRDGEWKKIVLEVLAAYERDIPTDPLSFLERTVEEEAADVVFGGVKLDRMVPSSLFPIYYRVRNQTESGGGAVHGVGNLRMVKWYANALKRLTEVMTSWGGEWKRASISSVPVFVMDIRRRFNARFDWSFAAFGPSGRPFVALRNENSEPTVESARIVAAAEAVHQGAHILCWAVRPPVSVGAEYLHHERQWHWFNEATAVFMESIVLEGRADLVRFARDWIDHPDIPLDSDDCSHQATMFVRYLARRVNMGLVASIWTRSTPDENPLTALNRILAEDGHRLLTDSNPGCCALFNDYCLDSYFLGDQGNPAFFPELRDRFKGRAIAEAIELRHGMARVLEGFLDHLSCRYYRIESASRLAITVKRSTGTIGVRLAIVDRRLCRLGTLLVEPEVVVQPNREDTDHLVLCVANQGIDPDIYDEQEYVIEVRA
jgi:hypothetical protein